MPRHAVGDFCAPFSGRRPTFRATRSVPVIALGAAVVLSGPGWRQDVVPSEPVNAVAEVPLAAHPLPIEVYGRVDEWMRRFMTDDRRTFQTFLGREGRYADLIRTNLHDRGMPVALIYLAMIESGFSTKATSGVSAAGVWQFMGPTARQYGLRVENWVDERRDPVRATEAALDYLAWLHRRYDSWYLAAAAYNAGPSRVDHALRRYAGDRVGGEDVSWEIIDRLPRETRDYVPKILAATALAQQAERYGFEVNRAAPYEFDRVWVPGGTSLGGVAKLLAMDSKLIRELNPHLVRGSTPPGNSYALRVPKGSSERVIAALGGRLGTGS